MRTNNNKNGFSMIELMVAMALGLFLMAGAGTVYMSAKNAYTLNERSSELDENARMAIRVLTRHIEHAGYASVTGMKLDNYILPGNASITSGTCLNGSSNVPDANRISTSQDGGYTFDPEGSGSYPASGRGDTIGLQFLGDEQLDTDCIGQVAWFTQSCLPSPTVESRLIYNSFHIATINQNSIGHDIPVLRCGGSLHSSGAQPWAEGVENIQFLYGIDSDGDGAVESYRKASDVAVANAWGQIITVRVGLLMRSVEPAFRSTQAASFQVLDELINTNDRYKREIYTATIRLKNIARRI